MSIKKRPKKPKCYCTASLRPDGTCPWNCPPGGNYAELRTAAKKRKANERRVHERFGITDADREALRKTMAKIDPLWNKRRRYALRGAAKSHAPGSRR